MRLMNFLIDEDLHKELKLLSIREGRSIKDILNEQAKEYVKTHKEGNPQLLITHYQDNEDFMGFPAMSIKHKNKKDYLDKMPDDMIKQLQYHIQEWNGLLKNFFI